MTSGYVFDIQNCSMHDGPGLRTTVFFKGCPLRCLWCANPESQLQRPQVMFYADKCVGCGECVKVCESGAITSGKGCIGCGNCVKACIHNARKMVGKLMTSEEVLQEIRKDKLIYDRSGGGVTLSGGEVLMQPDFAIEILEACQKEKIHTVLDTTAFCRPEIFEQVARHIDLAYVDMKSIDNDLHKKYTAVDNTWILHNFQYLDANKIPFAVRMPIIPGYNDSDTMIWETIEFLKKLKSDFIVCLLPFQAYGKSKYEKIGMQWPMGNLPNLDRKNLEPMKEKFERAGLKVMIQ